VSVVYAVWELLVALGAIAALIVWSQSRGKRGAEFWSWAAANSYGAFILHAPILVSVSRSLHTLGIPEGLALPVSVVVTAALAFGPTALLHRSALVQRIV
jgi:peptidoglycan/LPS O-acetylase OafA/YrhL